jgi:chromosome segregation ATPase
MATSEAGVQGAVKNACTLLGGIVKSIQNAINSEQRRLSGLESQLKNLEAQQDPDQDHISQIRQLMAALRDEIDKDQADLVSAKTDFESMCGPPQ